MAKDNFQKINETDGYKNTQLLLCFQRAQENGI